MSADAEAKIGERGLLRSERLRRAMLTVAREDFVPSAYRDHAYEEIPLPLPGEPATISCPHSYPLFTSRSAWQSDTASSRLAWGRATARPWRGSWSVARVVAIDLDAATLGFARENLDRGGYTDVVLVRGDGDSGTQSRPPTTGSASRRPAPTFRRR